MMRSKTLNFATRRRIRLAVPELRIARGERVAIIGASGAGKTPCSLMAGIAVPIRVSAWAASRCRF